MLCGGCSGSNQYKRETKPTHNTRGAWRAHTHTGEVQCRDCVVFVLASCSDSFFFVAVRLGCIKKYDGVAAEKSKVMTSFFCSEAWVQNRIMVLLLKEQSHDICVCSDGRTRSLVYTHNQHVMFSVHCVDIGWRCFER